MLFVLSTILILLDAGAQNPGEFTNATGGYSFTPSAGWTVRVNGSDSFVYAPEDGDMDQWDEKLDFSKVDGEDITLEDAFDFYVNTDFPEAYAKFKVVAQGDEKINGLPAKWVVFSFSASGEAADATASENTISATLQALFYVIKKDNALYLINGVTEKNLFSRFDLPFRTIIRTFRVNQ